MAEAIAEEARESTEISDRMRGQLRTEMYERYQCGFRLQAEGTGSGSPVAASACVRLALRSDTVEERAFRNAFTDRRSSVSCAVFPLQARSISSRVSRRRQSRVRGK